LGRCPAGIPSAWTRAAASWCAPAPAEPVPCGCYARRIEGIHEEAQAPSGQHLLIREFLHPQIDEIADTLPTGLGCRLAGSALVRRAIAKVTRNGMIVNTTSVTGFTALWAVYSGGLM
jgi:hypothetical protein